MGRKMSFIEVREAVRRTLVDITTISYCCELSVGREPKDMTEQCVMNLRQRRNLAGISG